MQANKARDAQEIDKDFEHHRQADDGISPWALALGRGFGGSSLPRSLPRFIDREKNRLTTSSMRFNRLNSLKP